MKHLQNKLVHRERREISCYQEEEEKLGGSCLLEAWRGFLWSQVKTRKLEGEKKRGKGRENRGKGWEGGKEKGERRREKEGGVVQHCKCNQHLRTRPFTMSARGLWAVDGAQGEGHNLWNPGFQSNTAKYEITERISRHIHEMLAIMGISLLSNIPPNLVL